MALRLAIAGAVALAAVGGALAFLAGRSGGPVPVAVPQPSAAVAKTCQALVGQLPEAVDGRGRRSTSPTSDLVRAWGDPPVVLFCGVGRPEALTPTSELVTVNGVDWLPVEQDGRWRFTTIGRTAYVEVVVPKSAHAPTDPLVDLATPVKNADPLSAGQSSDATPPG